MTPRWSEHRAQRSLRRWLGALVLASVMLGVPAGIVAAAIANDAPRAPQRLEETGLYANIESHTIASDVLEYVPQYPLWTDGALKRRWIRLPSCGAVDASDPDVWKFPVGTKLWKEFAFGRRIETRYMELGRDGQWLFASYAWSADERECVLVPVNGRARACELEGGASFDIPSRTDCLACHDAGPNRVLGFSALQLSSDRDPLAPHAQEVPEHAVDLRELVERGLVKNLPSELVEHPPRIEAVSARERAALGYLHANCGMCHQPRGPLAIVGLELDYRLAEPQRAPVLESALDRPSQFRLPGASHWSRIAPGEPDLSVIARRMASRNALTQMPPLGTRLVDRQALELVRDWISEELSPSALVATRTHPNSK